MELDIISGGWRVGTQLGGGIETSWSLGEKRIRRGQRNPLVEDIFRGRITHVASCDRVY